jgi:hypothetical protein
MSTRSFGRRPEPDVVEVPVPAAQAGPFRVIEVSADLLLPDEVAQAFYDQVRDLVLLAAADGMAAAMRGEAPPPNVEPEAEEPAASGDSS